MLSLLPWRNRVSIFFPFHHSVHCFDISSDSRPILPGETRSIMVSFSVEHSKQCLFCCSGVFRCRRPTSVIVFSRQSVASNYMSLTSSTKIRAILVEFGVLRLLNKFAAKSCERFPPHLNDVSTLPCETWNAHCARATTELLVVLVSFPGHSV